MKFILPIILLGLLTACGQSAEEKQKEQIQKDWKERNTSNLDLEHQKSKGF